MKQNPGIAFKLFVTSFLLLACQLNAQTFNEKERIERVFSIKPSTTIEVNNKYGRVEIKPWNKDSVKFVIDFSIGSSSLSRLQKMRSNINFNFNASNYYVTATTNFGTSGNQILTEIQGLSDALVPGKNSINIHYTVYCPEAVNITIINKFGDLYVDDLRGTVKISLANGDMKINSISGEAQIDLSFGTGMIGQLADGNISASYSDLSIKSAEKLQITSKSSTINLQEADLIRMDSRRDKLYFGKIGELHGSTNFSQLWIEELDCLLALGMQFGNLSVDKISRNFCEVNLGSEFTDINLGINEGTSYNLEISHHRDAFISMPDNEKSSEKASGSSLEYLSLKRGNATDASPIIIKAVQKCYISLREKPMN